MSNNNSNTEKDYIDLIENSPEFRESMKNKKNTEETRIYNKVANKISILSKITLALLVIFLIPVIATGSLFDDVPMLIIIVSTFIVISIFLEGFSEIIQLLQEIKDKFR